MLLLLTTTRSSVSSPPLGPPLAAVRFRLEQLPSNDEVSFSQWNVVFNTVVFIHSSDSLDPFFTCSSRNGSPYIQHCHKQNMLFFVTTKNAAPTWTWYALSWLRNVDKVCKPNTVAASTHISSRRRTYKLCALAILIADIVTIGCRQRVNIATLMYGRQSCKLKVWHDCVNASVLENQTILLLL